MIAARIRPDERAHAYQSPRSLPSGSRLPSNLITFSGPLVFQEIRPIDCNRSDRIRRWIITRNRIVFIPPPPPPSKEVFLPFPFLASWWFISDGSIGSIRMNRNANICLSETWLEAIFDYNSWIVTNYFRGLLSISLLVIIYYVRVHTIIIKFE